MSTKRLKRIDPVQAAKVAAVIYFLISLVFLLPIMLIGQVTGGSGFSEAFGLGIGMAILVLPVVYAVLGFVVVAISCLIYNLVAGWVGGIEVEVEEFPNQP